MRRWCPACRLGGDDDSPLEVDVVFGVEGAGPEGMEVETCKRGHLYPVDLDEDEAAEAAERED